MIYGYLCEDNEQELFLDHALPALGAANMVKCKNFQKKEDFCNTIRPSSSSEGHVRKNFVNAAKQGFIEYDLDLFIAVIDFDSRAIETFDQCHKEFHKKFDHKIAKKSILAIPVRTIEYWLWYLNYKDQDHTESRLESNADFNARRAKEELFPLVLPSGKKTILSRDGRAEITRTILQNADFKYLLSKSPSFSHFYNALKNFCSIYQ